ncbi:MAG TPA: ribonuclease III [Candidatus Nanoarchaeia archaeon]
MKEFKEPNLNRLEKSLRIEFEDKHLLKTAFTHRSYLNEHPEASLPHNERLEFLGDAVLGLIVSEHLYKKYPTHPEGDLTNFRSSLVNAKMLSKTAATLNLGQYLYLSRGEEATGGRKRQYILANTLEALIGAVYLDQGTDKAKKFVESNLLTYLDEIIQKKLYKDFKSLLQEKSQEKLGVTPIYKIIEEKGPDHAKIFETAVYLGNRKTAEGIGNSKQSAEQEAAKAALANWKENK